ncbi:MAG: FAD:protein FMN transferase [Ruminococcus sp.]|nr:FAD:protein FMN transferase [Ruminococcus sp.]
MKIKAISSFILCAAMLLPFTAGCGKSSGSGNDSPPEVFSRTVFAMDTYMNIKCYGGGEAALDAAEERIHSLENTLSVTVENSDVSRLNSSNGNPVEVSPDTAMIIRTAIAVGGKTGGALDITAYPLVRAWGFTTGDYKIPPQSDITELLKNVDYRRITVDGTSASIGDGQSVDLGALAKGYTGDEVVRVLIENGAESGIISLGGNVQSFGTKPGAEHWSVAVRDPFEPEGDMCILDIDEKAVITSGNYERCFTGEDGKSYWHIIDPEDGYPADNGIVSATIIGDEGLACDALSTAMFVAGLDKASEIWRSDPYFDMILVTDDGRIFYTNGLEGSFRNISSMSAEVISLD